MDKQLIQAVRKLAERENAMEEQLEKLVDDHRLAKVLNGLCSVCADKAEHLRANWQDNVSAQRWDDASIALLNMAGQPGILAVFPEV